MSTLRYDVTLQDWVIFAPERAKRPRDPGESSKPSSGTPPGVECPFCLGNERLASQDIFALREGPDEAWNVRVIPNKFPALRVEEDPSRFGERGLFREMGGCGAHEVVIESPDHATFLGHQPVAQIERVLRTLQFRMNDLMQDARLQAVILFKNHGDDSVGVTIPHGTTFKFE